MPSAPFTGSLVAAAALYLVSAATAGVIDTRPSTDYFQFIRSTGPDSAGGSFTADDTRLVSFTLDMAPGLAGTPPGGTFRAVVLAVSGGLPGGPVLWESGDVEIPASLTELVFTPDIELTIGDEYFIGFDTGIRTGTLGGALSIGIVCCGDALVDGMAFVALNGDDFMSQRTFDIASRIVMDSGTVPEPPPLALVGMALAAMALVAPRRRRSPAVDGPGPGTSRQRDGAFRPIFRAASEAAIDLDDRVWHERRCETR